MLDLPVRNTAVGLELPVRVTERDIPPLCRRLGRLLAGQAPDPVVCDAGRLAHPDLVAVEALARLQLMAMRHGTRIVIARGSPELRGLLHATGLGDVLTRCPDQPSR